MTTMVMSAHEVGQPFGLRCHACPPGYSRWEVSGPVQTFCLHAWSSQFIEWPWGGEPSSSAAAAETPRPHALSHGRWLLPRRDWQANISQEGLARSGG
jgi:hypothetical protein